MKSRRQDTKSERSDKKSDDFHTLRAENRKLKKKIAQLQKEINKLSSSQCLSDWDEDQPIFPELEVKTTQKKDLCPKCKSELTSIDAGLFLVKVCFDCGWKKRKPNPEA